MRVLRLDIRNVLGIEAAELTPDGKSVVISGPNESGKTSVLDSIFCALVGRKARVPEPVRQGSDQAVITLDLGGEERSLRVVRKFGVGEGVVVESADGARFRSPQAMLDEMFANVGMDPLGFVGEKAARQVEVLRGVAGLGAEVDELLSTLREAEMARAAARRDMDVAIVASDAAAQEAPEADPGERRSLTEVAALRAEEEAKRVKREAVMRTLTNVVEARAKAERRVAEAERQLKDVEDELVEARNRVAHGVGAMAEFSLERERLREEVKELPQPDFEAVDAEMYRIQEHNGVVDAWERSAARRRELDRAAAEVEVVDALVRQKREEFRECMAAATFPVEGLGLSDDLRTVLYNGVPLVQAPTSVQILVGVRVAVAANPRLRVLRVQSGNDLDGEHLAELLALAEQEGFQVWIERVADTEGLRFEYQEQSTATGGGDND